MSTIKKIFLIILITALAGYAVYMNIKLSKAVIRYEMSMTEMADRFEKVNEDALRAKEELARQMIVSEKSEAAVEAAKLEVARVISEVKKELVKPTEEAPVAPDIVTEKKMVSSAEKEKADMAKAEAEALLGRISNKPNMWEERGAHL